MENIFEGYNDELMPENFEAIARAYSKSLRQQGFVFINLQKEEFHLLVNEVLTILAKMQACLKKLEGKLNSKVLQQKISEASQQLCKKFDEKQTFTFSCTENENNTFLSLVSLENLLIIKLMLLSVKSEELELCHTIITSICSVFAESFHYEGFIVQ